jgi:hypothetical protein
MTVYVTEFRSLRAIDGGVSGPALHVPALANQVLTPSASSQDSVPFQAATRLVRIHTDAAVLVDIGPTPNADNGWRMAANQTETFGAAEGHKIAVKVTA